MKELTLFDLEFMGVEKVIVRDILHNMEMEMILDNSSFIFALHTKDEKFWAVSFPVKVIEEDNKYYVLSEIFTEDEIEDTYNY